MSIRNQSFGSRYMCLLSGTRNWRHCIPKSLRRIIQVKVLFLLTVVNEHGPSYMKKGADSTAVLVQLRKDNLMYFTTPCCGAMYCRERVN